LFVFLDYALHAFDERGLDKATAKNKLLEMFDNFRAVNIVEGIGNFRFSFFIEKGEFAHGKIQLAIRIMVHAMRTAEMEMRRKRPRGSSAK
jgi:hypothetical protein